MTTHITAKTAYEIATDEDGLVNDLICKTMDRIVDMAYAGMTNTHIWTYIEKDVHLERVCNYFTKLGYSCKYDNKLVNEIRSIIYISWEKPYNDESL